MYVRAMPDARRPQSTTAIAPRQPDDARARLVEAALSSLIDLGFSNTTGVEVCRRAGLTRGALNYHFPDYGQLLAAALGTAYDRILEFEPPVTASGPIEQWLHRGIAGVIRPEFKAIIELWLASKNDPELGRTLTNAIALGAPMFDPAAALGDVDTDGQTHAVFQTIKEACIGLGVGRATGSAALGHEQVVFGVLLDMARAADNRATTSTNETHKAAQ